MCFAPDVKSPPRTVNRQDRADQAADAFERRRRRALGVGANLLAGARGSDLTPAPLGARLLLGR